MRQVYQNSYISNYYSVGNVAVNVQPVATPKKKEKVHIQQNKESLRLDIKAEKIQVLDLPYVCFLMVAIVASFVLCVNYVQYNANLTASIKQIDQLENKLYTLQEENRTEEARIDSRVNLVEVKDRAVNELGMVYPVKGQVYFYKPVDRDYVTQYEEIKP